MSKRTSISPNSHRGVQNRNNISNLSKFQKGLFSQLGTSPRIAAQITQMQKQSTPLTKKNQIIQHTTSSHNSIHQQNQEQKRMPKAIKFDSGINSKEEASPQFAKGESGGWIATHNETNEQLISGNLSFFNHNSISQIEFSPYNSNKKQNNIGCGINSGSSGDSIDLTIPQCSMNRNHSQFIQPTSTDILDSTFSQNNKENINQLAQQQMNVPKVNQRRSRSRSKAKDSLKQQKQTSPAKYPLQEHPQSSYQTSTFKEQLQNFNSKLVESVNQKNINGGNYTSRNQQQNQLNNNQQSTLCNLGSVKNNNQPCQIVLDSQSLSLNEQVKQLNNQVQQQKDANQKLSQEIQILKQQNKTDKLATINQLKVIEENYQKYAYYYTKYLEDKIVFNELTTKYTQQQQEIEKQKECIRNLVEMSMDIINIYEQKPITATSSDIESTIKSLIIRKLIELNLPSDDYKIEYEKLNKINTDIDNMKNQQQQRIDVEQAYSSVQKQNDLSFSQKSDQKKGRSSSTPKTQIRYQEPMNDDEFYADNFEEKKEQAHHKFRNSIQSPPPPYDTIEEKALEGLRITHNDRRGSLGKSPVQIIKKPSKGNLIDETGVQDSNNVYEYTLKSFQYNDSERQSQSNIYFGAQPTVSASISNPQLNKDAYQLYGEITNCNNGLKKNNSNVNFGVVKCQINNHINEDLDVPQYAVSIQQNDSKMDTFSPKVFQERQSKEGFIPKISDQVSQNLQLKYSVEFVNTNSNHTTLDHNHLDCGDLDTLHTNDNSFVEQNSSMSEGKNNDRKIEIAVAVKPFQGEKEQDLTFRQGEKILIESRIKGSNWLYGSIGLRKGWFPISCVKIESHYI